MHKYMCSNALRNQIHSYTLRSSYIYIYINTHIHIYTYTCIHTHNIYNDGRKHYKTYYSNLASFEMVYDPKYR